MKFRTTFLMLASLPFFCNFASAQDLKVMSVFSGEYLSSTTPMFYTIDAWSRGLAAESITLDELYNEGWEITHVVKTNQGATTIQLLVFLEIPSNKFPETQYFNYSQNDVPLKSGSVDDL